VNVNVGQQEPSIRINLSTIYTEQAQQGKAIASIEGKLDRALDKLDIVHTASADHESRLRMIEKSYVTKSSAAWWLSTALVFVMAVTGFIALFIR
jgi:hypothetical protein